MIEVFREVKAKHVSQTDRHIGISAEVIIDLECKCDDAQPRSHDRLLTVRQHGDLFIDLADIVGKQYFFCQTAQESAYSFGELCRADGTAVQLLVDIRIAHDRSGDQLGEHGDIGTEAHQALLGICLFSVQIDRIGHRLECIKADADRQSDIERAQMQAEHVQVADQKVSVFEESEQDEVEGDAQLQPQE